MKRMGNINEQSSNRLFRLCTFCMSMYGESYVADVYHVIFVCPLVMQERIAMWQKFDSTCGANEWDEFDSVCELAWYPLCPRTVEIARVMGCFLSTYIGACTLYDSLRINSSTMSMRWFGGRVELTSVIKDRLETVQH